MLASNAQAGGTLPSQKQNLLLYKAEMGLSADTTSFSAVLLMMPASVGTGAFAKFGTPKS